MRHILPLLVCLLLVPLAAPAAGNLSLRVDGSGPGTTFDGSVTLTGFAADGGDLVASATLSGSVTDAAGERVATAARQPLRLRVAGGSVAATCDQLALRFTAQEVNVGGQAVRLEPIEVEVPARAGGAALRDLLCRLQESLRGNPPAPDVARSLDQALATLG